MLQNSPPGRESQEEGLWVLLAKKYALQSTLTSNQSSTSRNLICTFCIIAGDDGGWRHASDLPRGDQARPGDGRQGPAVAERGWPGAAGQQEQG